MRGEIVSVVDLATMLGGETTKDPPKPRLVLIESRGTRLTFMVDGVKGIDWFESSRIQEPEAKSSSLKDEYVKGHIAPADENGTWITFLDVDKIVHGPELSSFK